MVSPLPPYKTKPLGGGLGPRVEPGLADGLIPLRGPPVSCPLNLTLVLTETMLVEIITMVTEIS